VPRGPDQSQSACEQGAACARLRRIASQSADDRATREAYARKVACPVQLLERLPRASVHLRDLAQDVHLGRRFAGEIWREGHRRVARGFPAGAAPAQQRDAFPVACWAYSGQSPAALRGETDIADLFVRRRVFERLESQGAKLESLGGQEHHWELMPGPKAALSLAAPQVLPRQRRQVLLLPRPVPAWPQPENERLPELLQSQELQPDAQGQRPGAALHPQE
jgi:hypothetical protein